VTVVSEKGFIGMGYHGGNQLEWEMKNEGTHIGDKMLRTDLCKEPPNPTSIAQNFSFLLHCFWHLTSYQRRSVRFI
jgi:hypothetical protein